MAMKATAEARLLERIKRGQEEQLKLLTLVANTVIRDRLWAPANTLFEPQFDDLGGLSITYKRPDGSIADSNVRVHRHALNQIALRLRVDMNFIAKLLDGNNTNETIWKRELLSHILNEFFQKESFKSRGGRPPAFLHRLVGDQLRGFLSRSFNRHISSGPMLAAFVEACRMCNAEPVEAFATDVRFALKCFLPMVFEPAKDEFIAVGAEWSNSDFGSGQRTVGMVLMRVTSNTPVTLVDKISRRHIGSIIEDSDIELSDETAVKEVEAQASAIKDAVQQYLAKDSVERLLKAVELAYQEEVSWLSLRSQLAKFLNKEEVLSIESLLESNVAMDLPPVGLGKDGKPLPTRWWAANTLSALASKIEDTDRKMKLQSEAGRLLEDCFDR